MLMTAFALLVTAVIQAMSHRLSEYHALIVLKLNWVNSFNAVAWIVVISPPSATHQPTAANVYGRLNMEARPQPLKVWSVTSKRYNSRKSENKYTKEEESIFKGLTWHW
jgi:hypothetical protein